jgi:hypothetical protein
MRLEGKTIGVFVAPAFEDLEFWVPVMRLREEGARVLVIGSAMETVTGKHCLEATPDVVAREVSSSQVDGLVIPGGWAPDKLRRDPEVLRLVRECHQQGKIVRLGRHRARQTLHWLARHQGRPGECRRRLGGRARLPRWQPGLGPRRRGHPRLLPRAGGGAGRVMRFAPMKHGAGQGRSTSAWSACQVWMAAEPSWREGVRDDRAYLGTPPPDPAATRQSTEGPSSTAADAYRAPLHAMPPSSADRRCGPDVHCVPDDRNTAAAFHLSSSSVPDWGFFQ